MIRRSEKFCKEGVCSIQCSPHTACSCACFRDYAHTSRIQGSLYSGVCTFGALQLTVNFSKNWRGTYFRRGTYLRGFTVLKQEDENWLGQRCTSCREFSKYKKKNEKWRNVHVTEWCLWCNSLRSNDRLSLHESCLETKPVGYQRVAIESSTDKF